MKLHRLSMMAIGLGLATAAPADDALPLTLDVGGSLALCTTGTVICPARVICDDPSVVTVTGDERGVVLKGAQPGSTLCSAASVSGAGFRRLYRVTVVPQSPPAR